MVSTLSHVLAQLTVAETNDFGYPQNSEIDTLKSYITTESVVSSQIVAASRTVFSVCAATNSCISRRSRQRSPAKQQVSQAGGGQT